MPIRSTHDDCPLWRAFPFANQMGSGRNRQEPITEPGCRAGKFF
jgi:hypothetical protein